VWTGHLHLVPVGGRLVYMEPIFLAADADAIPELRRFVVSDGRRVVMREQLAEAVAAFAGVQLDGSVPISVEGLPPPGAVWPSEALQLLDRAEGRARAGDWQGFGEALEELRALLQRLQGGV
jgi:uncharacterized membrane protein (UPF0182 family)